MIASTPQLVDGFLDMKADYKATRNSRHVRRRGGNLLGTNADFHLRVRNDYYRMIEIGRELARDDEIISPAIERYIDNVYSKPFVPDPDTGDDECNAILTDNWAEWSESPEQCDVKGEHNFDTMSQLSLSHVIVDGDVFGNPLSAGQLEMIEGHRCRGSSRSQRKNTVLGVRMQNNRRRLGYHFTKDDVDPHATVKWDDTRFFRAWNGDERNIFHLYDPKRVSQTRGVTAMAPITDMATQRDDIEFAMRVKHQISAAITILRERMLQPQVNSNTPDNLGPKEEEVAEWERVFEKTFPGLQVKSLPGEKLHAFTPNLPGLSYLEHMRMTLTYLSINLGVPLIVLLMDATATNFSGWRGAIDQARIGWRKRQQHQVCNWHRPIYRWKVRQWAETNPTLRSRLNDPNVNLFRHHWKLPGWTYIEPLTDAQADIVTVTGLLETPRFNAAKRGFEWNTQVDHMIADNGYAIERALESYYVMHQKQEEFRKQYGATDDVPRASFDFMHFLTLPRTSHISMNINDTLTEDVRERQQLQQPRQGTN